MNRILVIGLQEATWDLAGPWVERGLLPNIAALLEKGVRGRVHAEAPLITPYSWANILTGVGAGQHGIFDYWQRGSDGIFRETTSASFGAPPIWQRLRHTGVRSTFVNVPLTWPPPQLDGVVVAGQNAATSSRQRFCPRDLHDRLIAAHGPYRPEATAPGGRKKRDYIGLFDLETTHTAAAFDFLLKAEPWDFAMVYFIDPAMAQHYFWADMEAGRDNPYSSVIASAYRSVDAAIGRLAGACGGGTDIFVISECGAGPIRSGINLNNWLERMGLLRVRQGPAARMKRLAERDLLPLLKRMLPSGVKAGLGKHSLALRNWAGNSGNVLDLDWSRTKVFSRGKEGSLFVNLAGRDPHGIVRKGDEYDELLSSVEDALRELEDPVTGAPVVASVARPEQLYTGPAIDSAPDLTVIWSDGAYMTTEYARGRDEVFVERWRKGMSWPTTGSHRCDGMLIAAGPGVPGAGGTDLGAISHFDLLPTWLSMLDQPVPCELKGRAVAELTDA